MRTHAPRQHRLRFGRYSISGGQYLVTAVTFERQPLFAHFERARRVAAALNGGQHWRKSKRLCWVLMPDHFHVLVEVGEGDELSALVGRVKARCTFFARSVDGSRLQVWQRGFHDHALRRDDDRRALARYIIRNPVRAGIVRGVGAYPFWNAAWL